MLSQLTCLYELTISNVDCTRDDLTGLPRVSSASLRSLSVRGRPDDHDFVIAFMDLFADCRIDHIEVHARALESVEGLFRDVQRICIEVSLSCSFITRYISMLNLNLTGLCASSTI